MFVRWVSCSVTLLMAVRYLCALRCGCGLLVLGILAQELLYRCGYEPPLNRFPYVWLA